MKKIATVILGGCLSFYACAEGPVVTSFKQVTKVLKTAKGEPATITVGTKGYAFDLNATYTNVETGHTVNFLSTALTHSKKQKHKLYTPTSSTHLGHGDSINTVNVRTPNGTYELTAINVCDLQSSCNTYTANDLFALGIIAELPSFDIISPSKHVDNLAPQILSIFVENPFFDNADDTPKLSLMLELKDNSLTLDFFRITLERANSGSSTWNVINTVPANGFVNFDVFARYNTSPELRKWSAGEWFISEIKAIDRAGNTLILNENEVSSLLNVENRFTVINSNNLP